MVGERDPRPVPGLPRQGLRQLLLAGSALRRRARPPTRSTSTAGTRTGPSGSTGSSAPRRRGPRSPGCSAPRPTTSRSRPPSPPPSAASISALRFRDGRNRIVISENEFPTIGQIAHAQELRGAEVVHVEPDPEAYAAAIDERTALVASTLVSYRTGAVHDVESIYAIAREHGALMLVDGYQGIGAIPLEASRVGDVVVGGTVKYLLASAGLAFMALRPGLVEELVPDQTGWFADENVFDMQIERYRPHRSARRFDAGTPPVPNIYAGVAGVGLIAEAGVPAIQEHVRGLVERLLAGLDELGATVAAPPRGPLVCVRSTDAPALVAALAAEDDRRLGARLEPPRLAPPLQHRRGRRRRPRRAGAAPRAPALAWFAGGAPLGGANRYGWRPSREGGTHDVARAVAERTTTGRARRDRPALGSAPRHDRIHAPVRRARDRRAAARRGRRPAGARDRRGARAPAAPASAAAAGGDRRALRARRPVDWAGKRESLRTPARRRTSGGGERAPAGRSRPAARRSPRWSHAGRSCGASSARDARPRRPPTAGEAMRLNERAAVLRSEERLGEALELSEQALAIFRTLGDRTARR